MTPAIPSSSLPGKRPAPGPFFLRKFLRDPGEVASIWPSSRFLADAMLAGIVLQPGEAVIELGPGTGPFTDRLAERLREVPGGGYLGIDRDAEFVAFLRARHPQLEFVHADAGTLGQLLGARPNLRPVAVVSGLPLVAMPEAVVRAVLDAVQNALPRGGHFSTFSYVHTMANPASWRLRRLLRQRFARFEVRGPVLRNLPPALVFAATC